MANLNDALITWFDNDNTQGVFVTDTRLEIKRWNRWLETNTGHSAADVLGRNLLEIYPDLKARGLDEKYRLARQGQIVMLAHHFHRYLLPIPLPREDSLFSEMRQSVQIAPLTEGEKVVGIVTVIEDVTERVTREAELKRQLATQKVLYEISQAVVSLDLEECLQQLVDQTARLVNAPLTAIVLRRENELAMGACTCQQIDTAVTPLERSVAAGAIQDDRSIFWTAGQAGETAAVEWQPLDPGSQSAVAVPLKLQQAVIAALVAESPRPDAFSTEDVSLLLSLAAQAALAIHNAQLHETLQTQEKHFRSLIENTSDLIALLDFEGVMHYISPSHKRILGYEPEELEGQRVFDFIHPDDLPELAEKFSRALQQQMAADSAIVRFRHKDGSWRFLEGAGTVVSESNLNQIVTNSRDVTQRKEMEAALARQTAELERSNAELVQFAYVASHDLQEPLRMVTSYLKLLDKRYKDALDTNAHEFIGYAVDGASRMQQLINDLLKYSRINTRAKPFEPTDCNVVLEHALSNLQIAIEDSQAVITHKSLPTVMGDEIQLAQLFQNLIGNALKFQNECAPQIHIEAELEAKAEAWCISVEDNGIGIDLQNVDRIFQIFQRLHTRQEFSGTGIGLAVCKKIVERHGGRIWVESQVGQGSTFYFTLPPTTIKE